MENLKPVLEMVDIKKNYFGNQVLKGVSLKVMPGEIHALCGENGAGKSTLMNILFGMPVIHSTGGYEGKILMDGEPIEIKTPRDAMKYGIGMVHQEFMLIPGFSIEENVKLNREPLKESILGKFLGDPMKNLNREEIRKDTQAALDQLGMDMVPADKVAGLPVGYMQFVEIAREIDKRGVKLLVFDEPTAVLTEGEAERLLAAMRALADQGIAILFITHRLDEVMAASQHVTIIRDGAFVKYLNTAETNVTEISRLMVGREVEVIERTKHHEASDEIIMKIENLEVQMPGEVVKGVNLEIKKGEILGIGGLAGQGKIGIANGIMGLYPATGSVTFEGKEVPLNNPKAAINAQIAFVSEDRRGVGLLLDESIAFNIAAPALQNQGKFLKKFGPVSLMDQAAVTENANRYIEELDIRCTGPNQNVRRLSGGNQQKVCIAKALTSDPKIIFVSEPTRGIDIGAKRLVLDTLVKLNEEQGMTVIITSSELAELRSVCDRIAIVTEGKVFGVLPASENDAKFGLLMSGIKEGMEG